MRSIATNFIPSGPTALALGSSLGLVFSAEKQLKRGSGLVNRTTLAASCFTTGSLVLGAGARTILLLCNKSMFRDTKTLINNALVITGIVGYLLPAGASLLNKSYHLLSSPELKEKLKIAEKFLRSVRPAIARSPVDDVNRKIHIFIAFAFSGLLGDFELLVKPSETIILERIFSENSAENFEQIIELFKSCECQDSKQALYKCMKQALNTMPPSEFRATCIIFKKNLKDLGQNLTPNQLKNLFNERIINCFDEDAAKILSNLQQFFEFNRSCRKYLQKLQEVNTQLDANKPIEEYEEEFKEIKDLFNKYRKNVEKLYREIKDWFLPRDCFLATKERILELVNQVDQRLIDDIAQKFSATFGQNNENQIIREFLSNFVDTITRDNDIDLADIDLIDYAQKFQAAPDAKHRYDIVQELITNVKKLVELHVSEKDIQDLIRSIENKINASDTKLFLDIVALMTTISSKLAAKSPEEEDFVPTDFLGGNCGFIMHDYEDLRIRLKVVELGDIDAALNKIGLKTKEDFYLNGILVPAGLSKNEIKNNLSIFITQNLDMSLRNRIYVNLTRVAAVKPSLNSLSIAISHLIYRLALSGMVLAPVIVNPKLALAGIAMKIAYNPVNFVLMKVSPQGAIFLNQFIGLIIQQPQVFVFLYLVEERRSLYLRRDSREIMQSFMNDDFFAKMRLLNIELLVTWILVNIGIYNSSLKMGPILQGVALQQEVARRIRSYSRRIHSYFS